ncbi:MAG TPA: demethoxyubiquinone hydroxylase family protein [Dehalococcoidales bacterium]
MSKVFLSLNFMHCMERFATQIYRTQKGAFNGTPIAQQLIDASENEKTHVQKCRTQIKKLNGKVYPLGWLFQFVGVILGFITRLCGKRNLFKADSFVEMRAVKDYNAFIRAIPFDKDTVELIRVMIADEEVHVINWKKNAEPLAKKKPAPV